MDDKSTFLVHEQPCDESVGWFITRLQHAGLWAMPTFDLQSARQSRSLCPCPHHGTTQCDCQMVVLLVYHGDYGPIAIIAHGYNSQTWYSMVDTPQQRADPQLEATIRGIVSAPFEPSIHLQDDVHSV